MDGGEKKRFKVVERRRGRGRVEMGKSTCQRINHHNKQRSKQANKESHKLSNKLLNRETTKLTNTQANKLTQKQTNAHLQNSPCERIQEANSGVDVILELVVVHVELEEELVSVVLLLFALPVMDFDGKGVPKHVAYGIRGRHHQLHHARLQVLLQRQPVDQIP